MRPALVIGKVWPEPQSSAAGTRMMQLLEVLASRWTLHFASTAAPTEYSEQLTGPGINVFPIALNDETFDAAVRDLDPEIVVFDRFSTEEQFGWRVAENCPRCLRILDTEDLHGLRMARETALKAGRTVVADDFHNETALRELAAILRSDISLIISKTEVELLTGRFKVDAALLHYLPYLYEGLEAEDLRRTPAFSDRRHFVSIGNFLHGPNLDALQYLSEKIWPLIRQELSAAQLHIYGAYAPAHSNRFHNEKNGLLLRGRAGSAAEVLETARVCLAPLRYGAGLKGKLVDAMLAGTPSVTTDIGAEGLGGAEHWPGAIANDPAEFARAAVSLHENEMLWSRAQHRIPATFNSVFNKKKDSEQLLSRISSVLENLDQYRLSNVMGAVLRHESHYAKRWLGKYLELKNRAYLNT